MADFTRFISYLYDYRAGERNRNLGFAKVEARQGMCRIGVNLNHGQVLAQNMVLYGYVAGRTNHEPDTGSRGDRSRDGGVWLVPLGEMERGSRERRWSFPLERLHSKGIALENLSGLILLSKDRESFLLSVWVDGPWRAEDIRQGELWESRREREDAAEECEEYRDEGTGRRREYEEKIAEIGSAKDSGVVIQQTLPETSPEPEPQDEDHTRYQSDAENDRIAMEDARRQAWSQAGRNQEHSQTERSPAPDSWRKLCKLFPAARPFEPSAWEVLCISLQDIGRLPPENWVWGNNHFLLHGFYQYHHLILARQRNENRIYLGVPGEFGVNEKFMAAMFGLHQFQRERQGKSDKGYWLTPIRL